MHNVEKQNEKTEDKKKTSGFIENRLNEWNVHVILQSKVSLTQIMWRNLYIYWELFNMLEKNCWGWGCYRKSIMHCM